MGRFLANTMLTPVVVCNDMYDMLIVYDLSTYREEFRIKFSSKITCITPSRDSRTVLISVAEGEVQMVDIENRFVMRKFKGLHQGTNIIRNCFGGAAENFVLSGSRGRLFPLFCHLSMLANIQ